jgi:hypothetical protein
VKGLDRKGEESSKRKQSDRRPIGREVGAPFAAAGWGGLPRVYAANTKGVWKRRKVVYWGASVRTLHIIEWFKARMAVEGVRIAASTLVLRFRSVWKFQARSVVSTRDQKSDKR